MLKVTMNLDAIDIHGGLHSNEDLWVYAQHYWNNNRPSNQTSIILHFAFHFDADVCDW
jgi:hypothetical protein